MVPSAFGTGDQGLRLMCAVNMQITAVRMDWRESNYNPTKLPLSKALLGFPTSISCWDTSLNNKSDIRSLSQ